ncbi:hypothetical protein ACLOJK_031044 [Asimina triloba]
MAPAKLMFLAAIFLLVSNSRCDSFNTTGKVWNDSSDCQYPCSPYAPPAPQVYPSPAAPPPPPSPLSQDNCPPVIGVACCQFPPTTPTNTPSNSLPYYRNSAQRLHLSNSPSAGFLSYCFILFSYGALVTNQENSSVRELRHDPKGAGISAHSVRVNCYDACRGFLLIKWHPKPE